MTMGIVERGRGVAIRRGATLGRGTAVGGGATFGSGRALVIGATSGGTVMSGDAITGSAGIGASVGNGVAAASGMRGEPVHATDAISAKRTSGRTVRISPHQRTKQVCGQPTAPERKCRGAECIGWFDPAGAPSLACFLMRLALIPPMPIAPMPGLASRPGG